MANNYEAIVRAVLDQRRFNSEMDALENAKYELQNVHIDTSNFVREIQNAINSASFTLNINPTFNANQAQNMGRTYGQNLTRGINTAINSGIRGGGVDLLRSKLQDATAAEALNTSFKNLYDTAKKISQLEIKISGLDPTNNSNQISVLTTQLNSLKTAYTTMKQSVQGGLSAEQVKKLGDVSKETADKVALIKAKLEDTKKYASSLQVITFDNEMTSWLDKNSRASKNFGASIDALKDKLRVLNQTGNLTEADLKDLKNEFKSIQQQAIATGQVGRTFGSTFSKAFKSIANYVSVASVISTAARAFRDMYSAVLDVDSAMVNLMKVTDETNSRYQKFLDDASKSAKELGRSISSLVEQSATWAKLGYSLDQAEELAKLSSIYANVAEVDDETAVSDMVTAMKAFNIEAEKAVTVIDPLNELGNTFATDAASLGDALSKSASAMKAAGTDMYKTLAMITGGAEITQNAGEFGNFLKVASMRIRGMKGELEELGEEVDESVDSISKVQTQILNLTHGEVNIFDDMGEFRDYYEIMEDISEVYDKLSSTEQASLTEILFGKMRGNQGQALLQAFQSGQIQKAYDTALNSAGSAATEQEKWMEGLEAKTKRFQAAWQEMSTTVLNSDFLKGLIDSGTILLEILTGIVETGAAIPLLFGGVGIAAFVKNLD